MSTSIKTMVALLVATALLASVALAQPDGMQDFPAHPGGRVAVRRVISGPLTNAEVEAVLAPLPARLRQCAIARARHEEAQAAGFDFNLEVAANGRARAVDLLANPADETTPHERAWLACGHRVVNRLRFPLRDAPSTVRLTLIWMRDDVPHGTGLL